MVFVKLWTIISGFQNGSEKEGVLLEVTQQLNQRRERNQEVSCF